MSGTYDVVIRTVTSETMEPGNARRAPPRPHSTDWLSVKAATTGKGNTPVVEERSYMFL